MAFKELIADQYHAGEAIGIDAGVTEQIIEEQCTQVIDLGEIVIKTDDGGTRSMHAWRGHSGPEDLMKKGGSRFTNRNPLADARELPLEMTVKGAIAMLLDADNKPVAGGKLVIDADPSSLSHGEKVRTFVGAADRMNKAGILDHRASVPAGDIGTNHPDFMDGYALRAREIDPGNKFWQATITGKSVDNGGLAFRPHATGFGAYRAAEFARNQVGMETADVTISGAGNVGGWTGRFMHTRLENGERPYRIMGYGDRYSTLSVTNHAPGAPGIHVTEMIANEILDNPDFGHDPRFAQFKGDKMLALAVALRQQQPDLEISVTNKASDILKVPSDIFVAASIGGLITENTIDYIAAPIIVEGANGPTTEAGYRKGLLAGKLFMVDTEANATGVDVSMDETNGNVAYVKSGTPMPDYQTSQLQAQVRSDARYARVEAMREELDTKDRRLAANAVGMTVMALRTGAAIDPRFARIVA